MKYNVKLEREIARNDDEFSPKRERFLNFYEETRIESTKSRKKENISTWSVCSSAASARCLVMVHRLLLKLFDTRSVDIYSQIYIFITSIIKQETWRFMTHSLNIIKAARVE